MFRNCKTCFYPCNCWLANLRRLEESRQRFLWRWWRVLLSIRVQTTLKPWPNGLASFLPSTRKLPKKTFSGRLSSISLANDRLVDVTQLTRCLGLGDQTVKNLLWLGCKFDLDQSERKSSQVNASARKHWSNGIASRPKFSTCFYLRLRLTRALRLFQTWLKPWPNGPASSRKWTQVELA